MNNWLKQFIDLPFILKGISREDLQLLKDTVPSTDNQYYKSTKYFEKEWMHRTSIDLWHSGSNDLKTNNAPEGYNYRLFSRFWFTHPLIWEFIHYLEDEETLVSQRMTHLSGGSGITMSTLTYSVMQSKRKAKENKKYLMHLEHLFDEGIIGVQKYLKSASSLVGRMPSQNCCDDEASDDITLVAGLNEKDYKI